MEQIFMYGLSVWAGALLFIFYSNMVISPQSMVKLTGLLALFLLGITFVIGPLSLFSRYSNHLKIYRKYLGVTGFFVALLHATLAFIYYFHLKISVFYDFKNPQYLGIFMGALGIVILSLVAITSIARIKGWMGYTKWKILQTSGYLAMLAIMEHFILVETQNGVFIIRKPLGKVLFVFGFVVILIRFIVFLLVEFRQKQKSL